MTLRLALVCALGFSLAACADQKKPPIEELPNLSRYLDVKAPGPEGAKSAVLQLGDAVEGRFDPIDGFATYELAVPAGLVELRMFSNDEDGIGTSPVIDTLLVVFGPQLDDGYPERAITLNDDLTAEDTSSRIELRAPAAGTYLVVATTYDNYLAHPENVSEGGYELTSR